MIILDTNVITEPMKPAGSAKVLSWLDQQSAETFYMTTTSLAELLVGVGVMPKGKRKERIEGGLSELISGLFGARILAFDEKAANAYATLVARARVNGRAIAVADGQIAAIAATQGFRVATRDTAPFEAAGVSVINPWH
jgi:predicted nucleic acid-binding protein